MTSNPELSDLAHKINVCAAKADDYRVTAAIHLAEAKALCRRDRVPFKGWVSKEIKFSYDEARKLAICGESDNPKKAIADMRKGTAARMAKSRAVSRDTAAPEVDFTPETTAALNSFIATSNQSSPNTGCNYHPADPRGADEDEDGKVIRRRAWLYMAYSAKQAAESFLGNGLAHCAIANADPAEIDAEILDAVAEAASAWGDVESELLARKHGLDKLQAPMSGVPPEKIEQNTNPDYDGSMVRVIDGKVWITTECGIPQIETAYTKVEDWVAALDARQREERARSRRRRKKAKTHDEAAA